MFPTGASTITLTGTFPVPAGGKNRGGKVVFTPSALRLVDATNHAIYSGAGDVEIIDGQFQIRLLCTDDPDIQPAGWRWQVDEQPSGGKREIYYVDLPATLGPEVSLDTLAHVSEPDGTGGPSLPPTGPAGGALAGAYPNPTLSSETIASFDPAGAAAAAQTAASDDATAKVAGHNAATNVHGIADTSLLETQTGAQAKAAAAQAAATTAAATDATNKVSTHAAASDPHGDRAYADTNKLAKASNLSDLANAGTARTNLGLANSATRPVGTTSNTVAAGDDSRLSDARTPTAHAASHASAGSDPVTLAQSQITGLTAALAALAPLASPAFTGSVGFSGTTPVAQQTVSGSRADGTALVNLLTALANTGLIVNSTSIGQPAPEDVPGEQNLLSWTYDPCQAGHVTAQSNTGVAGRITLTRIPIRTTITWSNIWIGLAGVDAGASLSNCYLGVYDSSGTLKGTTADISSSLMSGATAKALPLATPFSATPGFYYIAMLLNGTWTTNSLTFKSSGAGISVNAGLSAPNLRYSNLLTGQTSLPSTLTLSSQSTSIINTGWASQWYGVS